MESKGEIVIYQTQDGTTQLDVRLDGETVWITQQQMAELFQSSRTNVVEHIQHIYDEGELTEEVTCRKFRQVQQEGNRMVTREIPFYNLDMIISLGYRIRSVVATRFRQWASRELSLYVCQNNVLTGSTRVFPLFDPQTLHWFVYRVGVGNFGYKLAA